jgi:type I restriction enzyme S subunit
MVKTLEAKGRGAIEARMKPGWRVVRFGDVVRDVKVTVDPETSGLECYVAGEHMKTDDLHIRRWGTIGDGYLGPAFHRKFVKGQVLYGSRRTYLRKVAVAEFNGVCANTTFVLEPNGDDLLPELLPFVLQTKSFSTYAVKQSRGSVNPYVNWKDIASYEFALPPKDEQRRIADILWAADESLEKDIETQAALTQLQTLLIENFLRKGMEGWHSQYVTTEIGKLPESWEVLSGYELFSAEPRNGLSPEANAEGAGYPTLSIGAIRDGQVVAEGNIKYATISPGEAEKFKLRRGDVLIVRGNGNRNLVGKCGVVSEVPEGCFYPDLLIRIGFDESKMRSQFACLQWNSSTAHKRLLAKAKSTNGIWKVNGKDLRQHKLVVPPLDEQDAFLQLMKPYTEAVKQMQSKVAASSRLKRKLLNDLLAVGLHGIHV